MRREKENNRRNRHFNLFIFNKNASHLSLLPPSFLSRRKENYRPVPFLFATFFFAFSFFSVRKPQREKRRQDKKIP
jgi:hypothetical protein